MQTTQEKIVASRSGYLSILLGIGSVLLAVGIGAKLPPDPGLASVLPLPLLVLFAVFNFVGLYTLQPNQAAILTLFGAYRGTVCDSGLRWSNPFYLKQKVSLRSNNLNMDKLKVNDKRGNPVEIAAAVVWKIEDAARATFDVENYQMFVKVQAEAALRHVVTEFNYDHNDADDTSELTLMSGGEVFLARLLDTLQLRTAAAGIRVQEARITHLAYAPEIAGVMLRRQQAEAVISARKKIVAGAVGMVELALDMLSQKKLVELDDERKAAMVSNLLVVLCAEREVEPIINTGTLYH
jgi:regulator of protease activity HflC (stomatin/prohibitin superfamily)